MRTSAVAALVLSLSTTAGANDQLVRYLNLEGTMICKNSSIVVTAKASKPALLRLVDGEVFGRVSVTVKSAAGEEIAQFEADYDMDSYEAEYWGFVNRKRGFTYWHTPEGYEASYKNYGKLSCYRF